ncbi:MAG: PadR family transcriptional regulator, partial [Candidatus Rokuibacteriota bacterium]
MRVPRLSETEILIASAISGKELYGLQIVDEVLALTRGKRRISLGGLYTTL